MNVGYVTVLQRNLDKENPKCDFYNHTLVSLGLKTLIYCSVEIVSMLSVSEGKFKEGKSKMCNTDT